MMTRPDSHPDPEQVRRFGLGQLPDEQARLIESHVAGCARCTAALEKLRDDTLAGLGRRAARTQCAVPPLEAAAEDELATAPSPLREHPRYRVLCLLGRGGMGTVYLAEHRHMARLVALKMIKPSLLEDAAAVQRFRQEVRTVGRLAHSNIVHAHDAEEAAGRHFLVMEYVEGTSLAEWLDRDGRLPVAEACACARQAALALQYAHEEGVVHRDVKPHNLMRTADGTVKVLDFGLARVLREQAALPGQSTGAGTVMGTADYIAPEQAQDSRQADIRADVYSLGCTLYHLLSGRVPFPGGGPFVKILQHLGNDPEPLSRLRPDLPAGLVRVVETMMAKRPADRYQTPAEVAAALEPFARTSREDSGAPIAGPRARGPSRPRGRLRAAAVAALLLAGAAVAAAAVFYPADPDRGTPALTAASDEAEVVVKQSDKEVGILDARTGRSLTLPAGTYDLELVSGSKPPAAGKTVPWGNAAGFTSAVGIKLVRIPGGKFLMGSPREEQGRRADEEQHEVEVSEFYLGAYEVTQKQFRAVMGYNPSFFSNNAKGGQLRYWVEPGGGKSDVSGQDTEEFPVENLTWWEADEFCRKLTALDRAELGDWVYRLPREAEWEYACRGGSSSYQTFHFGNRLSATRANFDGRSPYGGAVPWFYLGRTCKVGSYKPNAFGLYDMHGNVWEWCADWYDENYYAKSPAKDPPGPLGGECRVIRGGSRAYAAVECRSAHRVGRYGPGSRYNGIGFRPALVPSDSR
jgi:formylglycine-generating enzyme required for sulfatase activity/tRNA A-37 threonylcarbamoyl transferase component Bud32